MPFWLVLLFAFFIGMALPVQAGLNAQLARAVGHPVWSALISFAVGTVSLATYVLVARLPTGSLGNLRTLPWYAWLGGVIGAVYVPSVLLLLPRLGLALSFSLIIAGQLAISLLLDHFGWLGLPVQPVSPGRILGAILLLVGVVLIRRF
jgi:transporter family-2 protein